MEFDHFWSWIKYQFSSKHFDRPTVKIFQLILESQIIVLFHLLQRKTNKQKKPFYDDSALHHIPTEMCLELPRKKYISMGKKAV